MDDGCVGREPELGLEPEPGVVVDSMRDEAGVARRGTRLVRNDHCLQEERHRRDHYRHLDPIGKIVEVDWLEG